MIYMNTKTTKFLAVLAVLAVAFAVFAVTVPSEGNDAADVKELDATEWTDGTLDNEGGYKLTKTFKPAAGPAELSVALTIQSGGVLDLSVCGLLTVSGEGSITVQNGGKIIGSNSNEKDKGIVLTATSGTPIVFEEGAIIGYAEYDAVLLSDATDDGDLNIFAASNAAATCYGFIQLQDIKAGYGGLSITVSTSSTMTLSGAADKAASETTGKVTIPRLETWGKINNATYLGDVTIGDLIVGEGVFCFTFGYIEGDVVMGGVLFNEHSGATATMNILMPGASIKVTTTGALRGMINYYDGSVKSVLEAGNLAHDTAGGSWSSAIGPFNMNACGASGFTVEYVDAATDYVAVQGTPTFGSAVTDKQIYITNPVTVPEGANFSFPDGSTLNATAKITNKGVMVLRGTASEIDNEKNIRLYGTITTLDNDGTVTILDPAASITNRTGTGTIDITGVSEDVTLSGNVITAGTIFNKLQNVTLIGDTVIKKDASITFEGNLIIPAGISLTIEDGGYMLMKGVFSKITNDGEIIIEGTKATDGALKLDGGEVINNNTIMAAFETSTKATNPTMVIVANTIFKNNDYFLVGENNIVTNNTNTIVNSAGATLEIVGDMGGTIINSGSVAVNSEKNAATVTVKNAATGATVTIVSTAAEINVDDSEFLKPSDSKFRNGGNSVAISAIPASSTAGGITIASGTYKETIGTTTYTCTTLIVSGAFDVEKDDISDTDRATLTFVGKRITADSALALAHTKLVNGTGTGNDAGVFYVSGTVAIDNTCEVINTNGTITVPGLIASNVNIEGTINAAKYEIPADSVAGTKKVYAYTNVPDAIDGAVEAGVKKVNVYGKVDVSKNITVPAGMDFVVNTGAELTIKKDIVAEVIFSDLGTAYLKNSGDIIVKGKLIIDNFTKSYKGVETGIVSEVVVKSGLTYTYTTLEWAMQDIGTAEATLTLCGETKITKDTTIPENITVDTDGNDLSVSTGAVLTIDGMLYLNGGNYTVADEKGVVVNGLIKKDSVMTYDGKGYPAGLYLSDEDFAYYYIGSIEDAVALAILADNNALVYYGDLTAIAIDFDVKGTLVFEGDVKAASMETGSGAAVTFKKGVEIAAVSMDADSTITFATANSKVEGTFTSPVGAISFDKTKTNKADSKIAVAANDGATTMTLSGGFENASDVEDVYQVAMTGDVALKANLEELSVGIGTVTVGAKVAVDYFDVYGTLVIDNTYSMTSEEGWVYGSLIANAATDSKAKATATVGDLYVGVTEYEASGAIVSGDVTVSDYAIVSAGATVPGTIESMTYSTDVYVEGKEFLTVYGKDAADISNLYLLIDLGISDSNADFVKWVDEAGQKVDPVIGTPAAIYAVIDYNVYTVKIVTDAGVKSVAVGGIELSTAGGNTFVTVSPVSAGTYKVTYTMKSGYSGDAVLYTSSGTILKDNSFVISAGADYGEKKTLTFQLAGTAPTPEPEPVVPEKESEWTITTILLVILVILIAIMAVIVALRLNRS